MLPKRLEMRNFLAYRTPDPLNFEDLHLACLSGHNGAGKSSLLDAITWAVWGQARTRSDDDLIHLGQTEMLVSLDFEQDAQLYRIIRKRKAGKPKKNGGTSPGTSTVDFFAWDEERGTFSLINEPSIRETQKRINAILRLDYDIFVNSAFLQQGKADAFTTKTPAQRKDILSDILGLDRWARYEDQAKTRLNAIQQHIEMLTNQIAEWEREIDKESILERELDAARQRLADADADVQRAEETLAEVQGADKELRAAESALTRVQDSIKEREKDVQEQDERITELQARLVEYQAVLDEEDQITDGYARLEEARQADSVLGDKVRELNRLVERIAELDTKFNEARQEIELKAERLTTTIDKDADDLRAGDDIREEMEDTAARIAELEKLEAAREIYQDTINDLNTESAGLRATNRSLKNEMDEIKSHLDLIENSTEARCPVCKQALDEAHHAELIDQMTTEGTERGDTFRANNARVDEIKVEIDAIQVKIQDANQHIKDLARLRAQYGGFEQKTIVAEEAGARIEANELQLADLQQVLAEGRFAEAVQLQLEDARAERDALDYDADTHDAVKETLQAHVDYQNRAKDLEFAQNEAPRVAESLASAQKQREGWQQKLTEYTDEQAAHAEDIERLKIKEAEMKARQEELDHQRTQRRQAENKVVGIEQELKAITSLKVRRAEALEMRVSLGDEANVYEQLKNAFGRNGIPAMMIEAAIPELEDAANRLLSRMTSNRMHIRFDTQREKKTGGIAETLDIWIQDELGQRDYSLYSGGEAFRVNFAIRVALSQLLARRAGAQLRALFIDEGFGTQDEAGRERLIEAITSIQDDFDLVLVITHIDELKDAFPARIEVSKTPNGSLAVIR